MASVSSSDQGPKTEAGCSGGGGGESSETVAASDQMLLYRGFKKAKKERGCTAKERISKMPPCTAGKRSSIYRGVTRYCDFSNRDCRFMMRRRLEYRFGCELGVVLSVLEYGMFGLVDMHFG
jgi:hypothetical protein